LLFFAAGDSDQLAQKLEYVASHPREVLEIVRRGQQVYLAHTWAQERQNLIGLVSRVLKTA
jgi:hypothetical protein